MALTLENYRKGFLIDEELMGGVAEHPEKPGVFVAFVLRHTTGEYLGYHPCNDVNEALLTINRIERPWSFERAGGCAGDGTGDQNSDGGGCNCGGNGAKNGCGKQPDSGG